MRRAILHVGTEKTGSTSIQAFLAGNIPLLAKHGIAYLPCCGLPASQRLVAAALVAGEQDHLAASLGLPAAELSLERKSRFRARLATELAGLPARIHTVLFSSEHLHSRLIDQGSVQRLHDLVAPLVDEVAVLVYLRRQDRLAVSRHTTAVLHGAGDDAVFPAVARATRSTISSAPWIFGPTCSARRASGHGCTRSGIQVAPTSSATSRPRAACATCPGSPCPDRGTARCSPRPCACSPG